MIHSYSQAASSHVTSTAFAALIWWAVPVVLVSIAIGYVVWTAKYKDKFNNETNRSVDKFQHFQKTLRDPDSGALE
jgi:cytochrome c-type biogenesis protein CcmH/NrfF